MQCPTCNVPLTIADRQGVEIDFCPKCRGVWLDRGELDKIIERLTMATGAGAAPQAPAAYAPPPVPTAGPGVPPAPAPMRYRDDDDDDDDDDWKKRRYPPQGAPGYPPAGYPAGQPYPPQYQQPYPPKKSKMKSLLGELFDF